MIVSLLVTMLLAAGSYWSIAPDGSVIEILDSAIAREEVEASVKPTRKWAPRSQLRRKARRSRR